VKALHLKAQLFGHKHTSGGGGGGGGGGVMLGKISGFWPSTLDMTKCGLGFVINFSFKWKYLTK
jgi:hypothetical protein